jgi:hypothetical protein
LNRKLIYDSKFCWLIWGLASKNSCGSKVVPIERCVLLRFFFFNSWIHRGENLAYRYQYDSYNEPIVARFRHAAPLNRNKPFFSLKPLKNDFVESKEWGALYKINLMSEIQTLKGYLSIDKYLYSIHVS